MSINPLAVTKFDRSDRELEAFLVYAVCVSGKQAKTVARQVDEFLIGMTQDLEENWSPFAMMNFFSEKEIAERLKEVGIGCYTQKAEALTRISGLWIADRLDLRTSTIEEMEKIKWFGPKTIRFFILHSRPNIRAAVIDTHILKHLAANGVKVPRVPPGKGSSYLRLEREVLKLADASGMTPAEFDLTIWKQYADA